MSDTSDPTRDGVGEVDEGICVTCMFVEGVAVTMVVVAVGDAAAANVCSVLMNVVVGNCGVTGVA